MTTPVWHRGREKEGHVEIGDDTGVFAEVFFDVGDDEDQNLEDDPEAERIVNLILAAPSLLAACKEAASRLHDNVYCGVRQALLEAIALAEPPKS